MGVHFFFRKTIFHFKKCCTQKTLIDSYRVSEAQLSSALPPEFLVQNVWEGGGQNFSWHFFSAGRERLSSEVLQIRKNCLNTLKPKANTYLLKLVKFRLNFAKKIVKNWCLKNRSEFLQTIFHYFDFVAR